MSEQDFLDNMTPEQFKAWKLDPDEDDEVTLQRILDSHTQEDEE